MPWTGWNESEVRPQRQAPSETSRSPAPAAMGFTAINSPVAALNENASDSTAALSQRVSATPNVSVASTYLGRGDEEASPLVAKPATKKASARSKKRAATAPNTKGAKRRKTSNVDKAMLATKPREYGKKQTATSSTAIARAQDQSALQHGQSAVSNHLTQSIRGRDESMMADSTSASALVSVIAPSTSMANLNTTSQQTSYDAVKASSGHGTMVYSSASSPAKQQKEVQLPQPLLPSAQVSPTRTHKSGDDLDVLKTQGFEDETNIEDDDNDFGALFDQLAQEIDGKTNRDENAVGKSDTANMTRPPAKKSRQQPSRKAARPVQDVYGAIDDDDDDDDDLAQALAQAEKMAKVPKKAAHKDKSAKKPNMVKQLPTPANSDSIDRMSKDKASEIAAEEFANRDGDMIFSDDEDEEMIELEKAIRVAEKTGLKPRLHSQNVRVVDNHEDYGGALLDESEKQLLDQLKSASLSCDTKPIVRSSFPQPVLDRSPIFGATNTTVLRTCFRLGEALNVGSHALRMNKNVLLEIYARVASSFRDGRKQHFIFRDLYHDKPPHLPGEFGLWNQSQLWELDSSAFLKAEEKAEGVMCRAVAKMKRDGTKWRLEVLSIWEARWEDVEAVAGLYAKC